jgi:hypothetical protein
LYFVQRELSVSLLRFVAPLGGMQIRSRSEALQPSLLIRAKPSLSPIPLLSSNPFAYDDTILPCRRPLDSRSIDNKGLLQRLTQAIHRFSFPAQRRSSR